MPARSAGQRNINREDSFIIDRVKNQTGAAEGSILPPKQTGAVRVPIVTEFRVLTRTGFLGGTEFVLAFTTPPSPALNISTYNFYYRQANSSSYSFAGSSSVSPVTVRIPIADPVKIVFICQTNLSNGFVSERDSSPSCTSETFETQITPGSISGLDLVFGGNDMTPAGRVPFTAASAGYLTTDAQLQFDSSSKFFGVGAGALVSKLTNDGSISPGGVSSVQSSNFTLDDTAWLFLIDSSGGDIDVTLPPASSAFSRWYILKKVTGDSNVLKIIADGSDTVDGAADASVTAAYGLLSVVRLTPTSWGLV